MYALYAFSRLGDDVTDSTLPKAQRHEQLQHWRQKLTLLHSTEVTPGQSSRLGPPAPLWSAIADSVQRYEIPIQYLDEMLVGFLMDVDHQPCGDWSALRNYCYHVASTVGIACTYVWRRESDIPLAAAIDCGIAFQLTNILRDVAEDARMGRRYVPQTLLDQYGVDHARWMAGRPNGNWQDLIQKLGAEAAEHYERGWEVSEALTDASRRMFSLIWRRYRCLLDAVLSHRARLWQPAPIRLSRRTKLMLLTSHFVTPFYARLPAPCPTHT